MIRSMTGYGRGEQVLHDRTITVELRAVNNRYLDCSVKLPRLYVFAEEAIKAQVQKSVGRGKVDVFLTIDSAAADKVSVTLNKPVADGYYTALTQMRDAYGLRDDISVSLLSRFPDVFLVEKEQGDAEEIVADISQVLAQALEGMGALGIPGVINNFNLYNNGTALVGLTGEISLPDFEGMTETLSGPGILGEIEEVIIGQFGSMELEIPFRILDEDAFKLMSPATSLNLTLRASEQFTVKRDGSRYFGYCLQTDS